MVEDRKVRVLKRLIFILLTCHRLLRITARVFCTKSFLLSYEARHMRVGWVTHLLAGSLLAHSRPSLLLSGRCDVSWGLGVPLCQGELLQTMEQILSVNGNFTTVEFPRSGSYPWDVYHNERRNLSIGLMLMCQGLIYVVELGSFCCCWSNKRKVLSSLSKILTLNLKICWVAVRRDYI